MTGAPTIELTRDVIDVARLTALASCDECGAISTFLGVTRNNFGGRKVVRLEYESYESMAIKQMAAIAAEVAARFEGVHRVVIVHRLGSVPVSEASVFIAVASEHRRASLDAVSFAIDTLKAKVPIWKREFYEDGTSDDGQCCHAAAWKANPESVVQ